MSLVKVDSLEVGYRDKSVLRELSLGVEEGSITAVVGHNGAGKTTLFKALMGLLRPKRGRIYFDGQVSNHRRTYEIARDGVAFVPTLESVFVDLSVLENLTVAYSACNATKNGFRSEVNQVLELFPDIAKRMSQRAGTLSGGQRQMLAIGCRLITHPRLLLLDEPSTGLAPVLVDGVFDVVKRLNQEQGITIILADQNIAHVIKASDQIYVLKMGRVVHQGSGEDLNQQKLWELF